MVMVGAAVVAVALVAGAAVFVISRPPQAVVPLSTPIPSTVAVVHA
jgi:hypothetical protein